MSPSRRVPPPVPPLVDDALSWIAANLAEAVPPKAIGHLLKAQRELIRAVEAVVEHNRSRMAPSTRTTSRRTRKQPTRVQVD